MLVRLLVAGSLVLGSCGWWGDDGGRGSPERGADDGAPTEAAATPSPLVWPKDAIVFASAADQNLDARTTLMAVSAEGGPPVTIDVVPGPTPTYVGQAAWSSDGDRLALVIGKARHVHAFAGDGDLFVMDADGTGLQQVTSGSRVSQPSWSPDGNEIALVRRQGQQLIVLDEGDGDAHVIATRMGYYQGPAWSPDGRWIAFQGRPKSERSSVTEAVYLVHPDGSGLLRLTAATASEGFPAWSPEGERIAYSAAERLWVMDADGSNPERITHCRLPCVADFAPTWSRDGRRIAFLRQEEGGGAIRLYVLEVATGLVAPLTPGQRWVSAPSWRP